MEKDFSAIKFSVIIPTLNEAEYIGSLIEFLFPLLNKAEDELIVVDANSTDDTVGIAESMGARVLLCEHKCRSKQMNLGASVAQGNILYFVHADSRPPASFRTDIVKVLEDGISLGCFRFKFDSRSWLLAINSYCTRFDRLMCRGGDQTLFVNRKLFQDLGGYREDYQIMEEYDFILRARKNNEFKIIPKDVIVSPRKYKNNSYLRVNIANLIVFALFRLQVSQERMIKTYKTLLNHPKAESFQ